MENVDNGYVTSATDGGITTITFFHPSQNSLPSALLTQLAGAITAAGKDDQTRVIVLKSGGDRTFCAGASFTELLQIKDKQTGTVFFNGFANAINACRTCGKIVIGRVQGKAVGGGVGLAAATDYCLATEAAAIKLSELAIGIGPFVIAPAVERKMGLAAFSKLTINAGEFQSAAWAQAQGLYQDVYADIPTLDVAVDKLAVQLVKYNPDALRRIKQVLWDGTDNWDKLLVDRAAVSGQLVLSDFTQKALNSFLNSPK